MKHFFSGTQFFLHQTCAMCIQSRIKCLFLRVIRDVCALLCSHDFTSWIYYILVCKLVIVTLYASSHSDWKFSQSVRGNSILESTKIILQFEFKSIFVKRIKVLRELRWFGFKIVKFHLNKLSFPHFNIKETSSLTWDYMNSHKIYFSTRTMIYDVNFSWRNHNWVCIIHATSICSSNFKLENMSELYSHDRKTL